MSHNRGVYVKDFEKLSLANDDKELHRRLLPLFFQNKFAELDAYMDAHPRTPKLLVPYLDKYCSDDSDVAQLAYTLDIPNIARSRLTVSAMVKAVNRFSKQYDVPKQYWPNLNRKQIVTTFYFLANQFYRNGSIHEEDFVDLLMEMAGSDRQLQQQLVNTIRKHDVAGAAWFVSVFCWPLNEIPLELEIHIREGTQMKPRANDSHSRTPPRANRQWHEPIDYEDWKSGAVPCGLLHYTPKLPPVLHHVNDPQQFVAEIAKIKKNTNIMAIDCEWKPTFDNSPPRLSLLQVATEDVVLIVDVLKMGTKMSHADWHGFVQLMSDKYMLKLGFHFIMDYMALANAHQAFKDIDTKTTNMLDLQDVCQGILKKRPALFPYYRPGHAPSGRGLNTFAELCLGVKLDKHEQFSKWDRRPLRESQKTYAVADVHCLLDIHRVLQMRGRDVGIYDLKPFNVTTNGSGRGDQN